jgi:dTDP-4-dehydrorhamnose reductase
MRVTVIGAGGNLGRHLVEELRAASHQVDAVGRQDCELAAPDRELLYRLRDRVTAFDSSLVMNCAAYTDVDGAEREIDRAFTVNALGAELVARAAEEAGASTCHISTDFVFDGALDRPYDEFDAPNPLSVYGRSKLAGEVLVQRVTRRAFVVRVGGLYGRGGRNFSSTLVRRLLARQPLRIDRERRATPTWVRVLSRQLIALCERGEHGLYHASCEGDTTWYDYAVALCEEAAALGIELPRSFSGVATSELSSPAPRPRHSLLENRLLRLRGLLIMPAWREAMREYLGELRANGELGG